MAGKLNFSLVSPEREVFFGLVDQVDAPGVEGDFGVLPDHAPFMTALREGLARFEPGAQGEHKLARGFLPAIVRSRHWIADPRFRAALADWCKEEVASVRRYARQALAHSPFKDATP